jgi:hypothetical protein
VVEDYLNEASPIDKYLCGRGISTFVAESTSVCTYVRVRGFPRRNPVYGRGEDATVVAAKAGIQACKTAALAAPAFAGATTVKADFI